MFSKAPPRASPRPARISPNQSNIVSHLTKNGAAKTAPLVIVFSLHNLFRHCHILFHVHFYIVQDRIPHNLLFLWGKGLPVPFRISIVFPDIWVLQTESLGARPCRHHVPKTKGLLVHHTVRTVDDAGTNGRIVPCCPSSHELQLHPKVFIKPGKTSPARILDILQFYAFSKQIPQGFFIDIHLLQDVPDVAGRSQREQQAGEQDRRGSKLKLAVFAVVHIGSGDLHE